MSTQSNIFRGLAAPNNALNATIAIITAMAQAGSPIDQKVITEVATSMADLYRSAQESSR
jgi:hypothetical protein